MPFESFESNAGNFVLGTIAVFSTLILTFGFYGTHPFVMDKNNDCPTEVPEGPFLYVTQHSGSGILKYSPSGCYYGNKVLKDGSLKKAQVMKCIFTHYFY